MTKTITKDKQDLKLDRVMNYPWVLFLHNDDHNTFDWVISCLMEFCDHHYEQASQCAHIVHFTGICDVKRGELQELKKMYESLKTSGLSVTLEEV